MPLVSDEDVKMLLALKVEDITRSFIIDLFAVKLIKPKENESPTNTVKKAINVYKSKHETDDIMFIPKGGYHNNPQPIKTTIGRFIYNKYFMDEKLYDIFGYINENVDGKKLESILDVMSKMQLNGDIEDAEIAEYMDKLQWFGFTFNTMLTSSLTIKMTTPLASVNKEKAILVKKYKKELDAGNAIIASQIEKRLLDIAKNELKNDPGMDMFESGSKASFDNNYKAFAVMKGPLIDTATGKYNISTSNYMDGIKKEELEFYGDSIVNAAYAKGKQTEVAGYLTKKYFSAFQSIVLDKAGSDCGSNACAEERITPSNKNLFLYRYILEKGKLILLDDKTLTSYVGKTVAMRSPLYCTSDKICNICAGDLYYKLGIMNIGLTSVKVTSTLLQKALKKFHDVSVKLYTANVDDLVL